MRLRLDPLAPNGVSIAEELKQRQSGSFAMKGTDGVGVPRGGSTNQVLAKNSATDYDTKWVAQSGGGGSGTVTSVVAGTGISVDSTDPANPIVASTITQYTDEAAQDAVGGILTDTSTVDFTYNDAGNAISAVVLDSPKLQGNDSAYHLSRTNHTGTQTASTISDFSTAADARISAAAGVSVASLSGGKIPSSQIPAVGLVTVQTAASQAAQLALTTQEGDVVVRTDTSVTYMRNAGTAGTMADFTLLNTPADAVTSVNGQTGTVVLAKGDVGLGNVDNTSDATKNAAVASFTNKDLTSGTNTFPTLNQNTTGSAAKWTTGRTIGITGDVTYISPSLDGTGNVTASSTVTKINGTALSGLATGVLKNTTATGVPSIATGADLPTMTATVGGAVPTPPNNTTTFLRGDGTFAAPAGGGTGDVVGPASATDTALVLYDGTTGKLVKDSSIVQTFPFSGRHGLSATGTDVLEIRGKSATESVRLTDSNDKIVLTTTNGVTSPVNYHEFTPSATTAALTLNAKGTDTNISYNIVPKGTGRLQTGGVTVPTISSADALTGKTYNGLTVTTTTGTLTLANSKTATINNSLTLGGTDGTTMTFPSTSATIARTDAANTFTGTQTFTAPVLGTPASVTLTNATGLPVSSITASTTTALGVGSIELGHATDTTLSRSSAGVLAVEGNVVITSASSSNLLPTGSAVQTVSTLTGALATGTTVIPVDDTIPQITEGTEFMTRSITPKATTNTLVITATVFCSHSVATDLIIALFQDATANALAVGNAYQGVATGKNTVTLTYTMAAGTTSATTFRIRGGGGSAGTFTFNGQAGARVYGGVTLSSIVITEYKG